MTIRFAAARGTASPLVRRGLCPSAPLSAINDNRPDAGTLAARKLPPADARSLSSALHHFSRHGLSAASRARDTALSAYVRADEKGYFHWLEICTHLDRRMAAQLVMLTGKGPAGHG